MTMKKRALYLILPSVTLILEILPYGAVCNFMRPPATDGDPVGHFRKLYSYFDLTPFGYANFAPLLTALATCVILALLVVYLFTNNPRILSFAKASLCIASILSFGPLLYGINFFSLVGALISISLIGELVLLICVSRSQRK